MISPQSLEMLKTIKSSAYGRALTELLDDQLNKLKDLSTVTTWDETLGRKHAILTIKEVFKFLEIDKKTENAKNQYQ